MNSSTGWARRSVRTARGKTTWAWRPSFGVVCRRSIRSLSGPLEEIVRLRSARVGRAAATSGGGARGEVGAGVGRGGAERAQEGGEPACGRLGDVDERVEVRERGAQVDERRVGAPQRGGREPQRLREPLTLV